MSRNVALISGHEVVKNHRDSIGKELPEIGLKLFEPSGSWFEENKIKGCLDERGEILSRLRIERDNLLSVAEWDPVVKKAVLLKKKGKGLEVFGHHKNSHDYLFAEEALFLIETNSLLLFHEKIHVSVEVAYSLLLNNENGCTLDKYRVFSYLSRLGYKVIRHLPPVIIENTSPPPKNTEQTETLKSPVGVDHSENNLNSEDVITIDDSSSDSSGDVVYLETTTRNVSIPVLLDEDSKDSVIIIENNVEILDLEGWPFVYCKKFIKEDKKEHSNGEELETWIGLNQDLIGESDEDVLNRIPNLKNNIQNLRRPDLRLLPTGVRPRYNTYQLNVSVDQRRGFTPRRRGFRGFRNNQFGMRDLLEMKSVAINMLKYASAMMGNNNQFNRAPRPFRRFRGQRGRGRRPFRAQRGGSRFYNHFDSGSPSTVVISDDEDEENEEEDSKRGIKRIASYDLIESDSKRIALGSMSPSIKSECSSESVKIEPDIKSEFSLDIKTESNQSVNSLNRIKIEDNSIIKVEAVKAEKDPSVKLEPSSKDKNSGTESSKVIDSVGIRTEHENTTDKNTVSGEPQNEEDLNGNKSSVHSETAILKEKISPENENESPIESEKNQEDHEMEVDKTNIDEVFDKDATINNEPQSKENTNEVPAANPSSPVKDCSGQEDVTMDEESAQEPLENDEHSNNVEDAKQNKDDGNCSVDDEKADEEFDYGEALVQPHHCFSIENVLSTLQIFEGFDGEPSIVDKELTVVYDVYLPSVPFRKSAPDPPNFRLIIIGLDDPLPNANQMSKLKNLYQDRVQFLFAIPLKESVAFYLYDSISLPTEVK